MTLLIFNFRVAKFEQKQDLILEGLPKFKLFFSFSFQKSTNSFIILNRRACRLVVVSFSDSRIIASL